MARFFAAFAVLFLLFVGSALAQPFSVQWGYVSDNGDQPLATTCGGATPLPDGRIIKVFWDVDSDGPDATDPQPTVCIDPPICEQGPPGTVNYNSFSTNGAAMGYGPGYFLSEYNFTSSGILPDPPRYYLRIYEADGTNYLWTSVVKTLTIGPQDVYFTRNEWTCGLGGPQCVVRDEHE